MAKAKAFIRHHPAWTTIIIVALAVVFLGAKWFDSSEVPKAARQFVKVKRGDFRVTVSEGGTLDSTHKRKLECELDGGGLIVDLVPEGTYVRGPRTHTVVVGDTLQSLAQNYAKAAAKGVSHSPETAKALTMALQRENPEVDWNTLEAGAEIVIPGQLLIKFEDGFLREKILGQEKAVTDAQRDLANAKKDLELKKLETEAADEQAALDVEFAEQDLEKYTEGEYPLLKLGLEGDIKLAEQEIKKLEKEKNLTEKLLQQKYATQLELEAKVLAIEAQKNSIAKSNKQLELLEKYDSKQQIKRLHSAFRKAKLDELRTQDKSATLRQSHAEVVTRREESLARQQEKLTLYQQQLVKTEIRAPQDGLVIFAMSSSSRYSNSPVEKGAELKKGQDLITLPDTSQMMAVVRVHESHVRHVKPGMQAVVRIDSLPDREFRGEVRKVAPTPDRLIRYYEDISVYHTDVGIVDAGNDLPADLKPGVSAKAEIIIAELENVLMVPVQCVTTHRGSTVVQVKRGARVATVPIQVGHFNDRYIEIKAGLREGDQVALSPRLDAPPTATKKPLATVQP